MRRFFFPKFLDEYRLNFIFVKFSTKNFYENFFSLHRTKLLPHYHTKSLKSNFLTPKSYSAPTAVKFYIVSNFGRANKLQLISWKLDVKLFFRIIKFEKI